MGMISFHDLRATIPQDRDPWCLPRSVSKTPLHNLFHDVDRIALLQGEADMLINDWDLALEKPPSLL